MARPIAFLNMKYRLYCTAYNPANGNPLTFDAPGPTIAISDPAVFSSVNNGDNSFTLRATNVGTSDISITGKVTIGGTQYTRTWGPATVDVISAGVGETGVDMTVTVTSVQLG